MKVGDLYKDQYGHTIKIVEVGPDLLNDFVTAETELGNRFHVTVNEVNNEWELLDDKA